MSRQHTLVFSTDRCDSSFVVYISGQTWVAFSPNTPNRLVTTSIAGMLAYLELLYMSEQAPFDKGNKWRMCYKVDGKIVVSTSGEFARSRAHPESTDARMSIFARAVKSGLSLLNSKTRIVDTKDDREDQPCGGYGDSKDGYWYPDCP